MKGDGRCMAGAWLANERGGREGGKEGTEGRADDEWPGNPDRICPTDPTERDSPVALESSHRARLLERVCFHYSPSCTRAPIILPPITNLKNLPGIIVKN